MNSSEDRNQQVVAHSEDYYEEVTSQEQTYLGNVEENLRVILEGLPGHAVEERNAGNADSPQLSDEIIAKMYRWFGVI
jgi:hypothetical protein